MYADAYQLLSARQDHYWWHRARRAMCLALIQRQGISECCRWLDLGCGPGGNLGLFDGLAPELIVGIDLSSLALELAQQRAPGVSLVRADISRSIPFADSTFDVLTVFNVLYHAWVVGESQVLSEVIRVLKPGGIALITEPAFPELSRKMDQLDMARRRYRLREFKELCQSAKLEVAFASYFTSFGAVILFALKAAGWISARLGHQWSDPAIDLRPVHPIINEALYFLALLEGHAVARHIRIPIGTTLLCLAQKPR
jgi:ubiquinone/menaquinone biosynthesis C-methylase UbiE